MANKISSAHPPALPMLFLTEMWERFSYYGMRALLVLYLVNSLHYARQDALKLYAIYTSLVYLTPIIGGYLADRYLGTRKAILIGGITMALGHFAMASPALLHLALGLLIIGNGFFKPNIGSLLGTLYEPNDPRRDSGFIIFYIGVNLGAFLSPLVAGTLGEKVGWDYGFASAGVGMCLGLAQFIYGQHKLGTAGLLNGQHKLERKDWLHIIGISFAMIPLVYIILHGYGALQPAWGNLNWMIQSLLVILAFISLWFTGRKHHTQKLDRNEWRRIIYIMIMGLFVIFFWMGFEQGGGTMNLFADQRTDRMLLGWEIPASYFQAINPLTIILLGPLFAMLWRKVDQSRFCLASSVKMGLGMLLLGLGFAVLAIADKKTGMVGPQWLMIVYVLHTLGELCLSPIGLAMVTNISPARVGALMLGLWYLSNAFANYLAGMLESYLKNSGLPIYWFLVASSIGAGLLLITISPLLNNLLSRKLRKQY